MRLLLALLGLLLALLAGVAPAMADCPLDLGRGTAGSCSPTIHDRLSPRAECASRSASRSRCCSTSCTKNGNPAELVAVEAQMPEQKRAMKYKPTIVSAGEGRYRAEGMVFDMPGRWETRHRRARRRGKRTPDARDHPEVRHVTISVVSTGARSAEWRDLVSTISSLSRRRSLRSALRASVETTEKEISATLASALSRIHAAAAALTLSARLARLMS